jgi:hypothetical protein
MAANPRSITKFRALQRLDEWSAADDRQELYSAALARLADPDFNILGPTVAGIEGGDHYGDGEAPLEHLKDHWLSGQYFPNLQSAVIVPAIREGFLRAIEEAQQLDLPLNAIWVRGAGDPGSEDFRVDHVVGPTAVTVAIITPPPKGYYPEDRAGSGDAKAF